MWDRLVDWFFAQVDQEPAKLVARLLSSFVALVGLLAIWQVDMSDAREAAIKQTIILVVPLLLLCGRFIRNLVTPVAKAEAAIEIAQANNPHTTAAPKLSEITPQQIAERVT